MPSAEKTIYFNGKALKRTGARTRTYVETSLFWKNKRNEKGIKETGVLSEKQV